MELEEFTVIFLDGLTKQLELFNCEAFGFDHAEILCKAKFPQADVQIVNLGHNNTNMEVWGAAA